MPIKSCMDKLYNSGKYDRNYGFDFCYSYFRLEQPATYDIQKAITVLKWFFLSQGYMKQSSIISFNKHQAYQRLILKVMSLKTSYTHSNNMNDYDYWCGIDIDHQDKNGNYDYELHVANMIQYIQPEVIELFCHEDGHMANFDNNITTILFGLFGVPVVNDKIKINLNVTGFSSTTDSKDVTNCFSKIKEIYLNNKSAFDIVEPIRIKSITDGHLLDLKIQEEWICFPKSKLLYIYSMNQDKIY